jgi:hypothetical protein
MWQVEGFDLTNNIPFCYVCHRVVLATGSSDLPNRLGVPGESANPTWVLHDLRSLEAALNRLVEEEEGDREGRLLGFIFQILLTVWLLTRDDMPGI